MIFYIHVFESNSGFECVGQAAGECWWFDYLIPNLHKFLHRFYIKVFQFKSNSGFECVGQAASECEEAEDANLLGSKQSETESLNKWKYNIFKESDTNLIGSKLKS